MMPDQPQPLQPPMQPPAQPFVMPEPPSSQRRGVIVIIALVVIVLLGLIIRTVVMNTVYTGKLEVEVAPASSSISVGGHATKAGIVRVRPGKVEVKVSKKGFASQTQSFTVAKGKTVYAGFALDSNESSTKDWYSKHPDDQQLREKISGRNFDSQAEDAVKATPFIQKLPYVDPAKAFRIDYGNGGKDSITQTIYITTVTDASKQAALDWIKKAGTDPATLTIKYLTNPLLGHLPYSTLTYSLTDGGFTLDSSDQPYLTLNATINLTQADNFDTAGAIAQYKQDITGYIKSFGVDPNKYVINYQITQP